MGDISLYLCTCRQAWLGVCLRSDQVCKGVFPAQVSTKEATWVCEKKKKNTDHSLPVFFFQYGMQ